MPIEVTTPPLVNPNWPVLDYGLCCTAGPQQPTTQPWWTGMARRTQGPTTTRRGKQYELDQVQPGEHTVVLDNRDGALDPVNTGSPFAGYVTPFRLWRLRAQWPPTPNLLTSVQAAGGAVSVPAGASNSTVVTVDGWSLTPGQPHAAQVAVSSPSTGVTARVVIEWLTVTGTVAATVASAPVTLTTGYTTLTVAGTPPATAVATHALLQVTTTAAVTVNHQSWQVEQAATSTGFQTPGTWYPLFTGYVERWPQLWQDHGMRGETHPIIVDALGFLSQQTLKPAYINDLLALTPTFLYALDEPAGSTLFRDLTGNRRSLTPVQGPAGPGAGVTAGTSNGTPPAAFGTSGAAFLGAPGPTVGFNNTGTPPAGQTYAGFSVLNLGSAPGEVQGFPPGADCTRLYAIKSTADPTADNMYPFAEYAADPGLTIGFELQYRTLLNQIYLTLLGGKGSTNLTGAPPGQWNLVSVSVNAAGTQVILTVNSNSVTLTPNGAFQSGTTAGSIDYVGGTPGINVPGFVGDVALVAQIPAILSSATLTALWASFAYGWGGRVATDSVGASPTTSESSGTRYKRLVAWSPFGGTVNADPGETTLYGPATDLNASSKSAPSVVTALQAVVDTENGDHYVDGAGTLVFKARSARYTITTPVVTFGEHPGEIPYLDVGFDFDPSHIVNDTAITEAYTGAVAYSSDPTSQSSFGTKSLQRTINTLDPLEVQAAADFFVVSEKNPKLRVTKLTVDPSANPSLWQACLGLDLGQRVRVNRRPPTAPLVSFDGWVEAVAWNFDPATTRATVTVEIVPILPYTSAQAAATILTLNQAVTAGATTLTLDPLPDAATNPAAANISGQGDTWYLEPGTPRAETVTLAAVGATTPGYTSFTLTLQTGAQYPHAAGAVVVDTPVTNPHTWDANAAADTAAAAY